MTVIRLVVFVGPASGTFTGKSVDDVVGQLNQVFNTTGLDVHSMVERTVRHGVEDRKNSDGWYMVRIGSERTGYGSLTGSKTRG